MSSRRCGSSSACSPPGLGGSMPSFGPSLLNWHAAIHFGRRGSASCNGLGAECPPRRLVEHVAVRRKERYALYRKEMADSRNRRPKSTSAMDAFVSSAMEAPLVDGYRIDRLIGEGGFGQVW